MTFTKEQIDQAIALEQRIIRELSPRDGDVRKAETVERDTMAIAVSQSRLKALDAIRRAGDFDGHARAWEQANPPQNV